MPTVFSTLATDVSYNVWVKGGADLPQRARSIVIKGGTGVANKHILTPLGVATQVSDEDALILGDNPVFKKHAENGFVMIQKKAAEPEKVAANMNTKDPSAPKTPSDYLGTDTREGNQLVEPTSGKKG